MLDRVPHLGKMTFNYLLIEVLPSPGFQMWIVKVEKILKGSLNSIPSPLVKIQIIGGKIRLSSKGKTLLDVVNKVENKKFVDNSQQCFAFIFQANIPAHNLNLH